MRKKINILLNIKRLLAVVLVLAVAFVAVVSAKREKKIFVLPDTTEAEIYTNRLSQYVAADRTGNTRLTLDGFERVTENSALALYLRRETASLRVLDKKSGYVWGMLKGDTAEDLNDYWMEFANSMATVEYFDANNNSTQVTMSDERVNVQYSVEAESCMLACAAECEKLGIAYTLKLKLTEDSLEASVTDVREYGDCKIARMYILPFLGSVAKGEMDGYIFIPDGSGALMRFNANTFYSASYSAKIYGADIGIDNVNQISNLMAKRTADYLTDEYKATVPVLGIVHGAEQYGVMINAASGAEYGIINASLAGETVPYNWACLSFEYRQMYNQPVSKTKTVAKPQENANRLAPKLSYRFLSGNEASYSGMAVKYRAVLEKEGILKENADKKAQIPMRVNIVASEIKDGLFFDSTTALTTAAQAEYIRRSLCDAGISNLVTVVEGWQKGGLNGNRYGTFKTEKSVGGLEDWKKFKDTVEKNGGRFYLQINPIYINKSQANLSYAANISASKELSCYVRDNNKIMFNKSYVVNPINVLSYLDKAKQTLNGFNLNISGFGGELYSHYSQEGTVGRTRTMELFEKRAESFSENGTRLSMNSPNYYMWQYCTDYFDIPMMNSQYTFETDSVPFLQILLKGYVSYYAPYANQGFYRTSSILKTIEYGAYPSFYFIGSENSRLVDTPLVDYFSLNFSDWETTAAELYSKVNEALLKTEGASIIEHKVLDTGLVRVTYSNGVRIYVNYNSEGRKADGSEIPALGFFVGEGV